MFCRFFKNISKYNNTQLGQMTGFIIGTGAGMHAVQLIGKVDLPIMGSTEAFSSSFCKGIAIPFIGGTYSNYFSNLGAAVDIITNKKTIFNFLSYIHDIYSGNNNAGLDINKTLEDFVKRVGSCNNQELGYLIGTVVGLYTVIYGLPMITSTSSLPLTGTTVPFNTNYIKAIAIPYISGNFSNLFSHFGAGLDTLTSRKTIIDVMKNLKNHFFNKSSETPIDNPDLELEPLPEEARISNDDNG